MAPGSTGMLRHVVLRKLASGPRSGYQLCTEIEREVGKRPSYGSIYPILERLAKSGTVTVTKDGRRKIYALTPSGVKAVAETEAHCAEFVDEEHVRIKRLMAIMEMDPAPMLVMLDRVKRGNPPLGKITAQMFTFRDLIFAMAADGRADRNAKEINTMLSGMIKRLERMR